MGNTGETMISSVEKTGGGGYRIRLGEGEAELSQGEVKTLLIQILAQMAPGAAPTDPTAQFDSFLKKLADANDVGIETLIRSADDDDVLVMLKSAEGDEALLAKLYHNMSERTAKMYQDDLGFRFADGIPATDLSGAFARLTAQTRALESEGVLSYGA